MLLANFQVSVIGVINLSTASVNLPKTYDKRQLDYLRRQFVIKVYTYVFY